MPDTAAFTLRPMTLSDLDQVLTLQAQAYGPGFHESPAAFAAKIAAWPDCNQVAVADGGLLAYLFAQPARRGYPPPLDDPGTPVAGPDALHLHDMSVAPQARGQGLAQALCAAALARGSRQGYAWATLVAVQDSLAFWQKQGFALATPGKSLDSYGPGATYLLRSL